MGLEGKGREDERQSIKCIVRELEKDRKREEKKHNEGRGKCNQKKNGKNMRKFGTKKKEDF